MAEKVKFEIDLSGIRTQKEFHERIQNVLPCPDYYGRNLDALYDVLTERGGGWEVVFHKYEDFADSMPGYAAALKNLCEEAAAECPELRIFLV